MSPDGKYVLSGSEDLSLKLWDLYNDLVRRSGAIVFSSCLGGEFSYEKEDIENGFFTEAILAAFAARFPGGGR